MKGKIMAVLLAAAMTGSLAGCGSTQNKNAADASEEKMKVAMVTDSGDITDQSFNQMTYEACKAWGKENDIEFNYYKPQSDSDEARTASVDQAVADGANVIVLSGYVFAPTVIDESDLYPEVKFLALDVSAGDICEKGIGEGYDYNPDHYNVTDYYNEDNVYCCTYQEELSGFMAGYAAVMLGYRHLGFLGGMSVPAVNRYGYGYVVQGADAAAKELGITDEVQVEYVCGGQFYGDADITAYMDTWYGSKGVEVVFACGGGIYTSAAEAAVKTGGKVIGVDSDQSATIDDYKEGLTVTSAMKGLQVTIDNVLDAILDNEWDKYVGKIENLGMESPDPAENYVQLPEETTQWDGTFTKEDYQKLVQRMYNGEYEVSSDSTTFPETEITATDYGSIK